MSYKDGRPDDPELRAANEVLDRMRGGPKAKLRTMAEMAGMNYANLMEDLAEFIRSGGATSIKNPTDMWDEEDVWVCYELITGCVVPPSCRHDPFQCCA